MVPKQGEREVFVRVEPPSAVEGVPHDKVWSIGKLVGGSSDEDESARFLAE
jgi:hypothetical protein